MPKITLTESEYKHLVGDRDEPTKDMDPEEYLAIRNARIAEAEARGDDERVEQLLADFPHPAELASQEVVERSRAIEEHLVARQPQTDEERAAFHKGLDEIPDGDKEALKAYLAEHGYVSQADRVAMGSA